MRKSIWGIGVVVLALGWLVWQDATLLGQPRTRMLMHSLPEAIGRDDVTFRGFEASQSGGREPQIARFAIAGNAHIDPFITLGEDGCGGPEDCAARLSAAVDVAEARTRIAVHIVDGFEVCGIRANALRNVALLETTSVRLSWPSASEIVGAQREWDAHATVLLNAAIVGPSREAFLERVERCVEQMLGSDWQQWRAPAAIDLALHILPWPAVEEIGDAPRFDAWADLSQRAYSEARFDVRTEVALRADPTGFAVEPITGDFALIDEAHKAAVEDSLRLWLRDNGWADEAAMLDWVSGASSQVRAVGDDPDKWRMLMTVWLQGSENAHMAVTYNTRTRQVDDITMVYDFGDPRNAQGIDWPQDGGLYLP